MAGFIGENRLTELLTLIKNKFVTKDQVATSSVAGVVKPDGTTIIVDNNGVISGNGGGASLPTGGMTGQALVKKTNTDQDVEWATISGSIVEYGFTPIGTIIAVMGNMAPANYLACDGSIIYIEDYPELAQYFKDQFGISNYFGGDGTTTFAIPDLRGEFLRGTGTNSHVYQGNGENVGWHQDATLHNNFIVNPTVGRLYGYTISATETQQNLYKDSSLSGVGYVRADGTYTTPSTAEIGLYSSRPTNTSVLYCIATNNIYLNPALDYDMTEKIVGSWIDGKPIYQKTVNFGALPNNTTKAVPSGITNIDYIVSIKAVSNNNSYGIFTPDITSSSTYERLYYDKVNNDIIIHCSYNANNYSTYITIQYTKTTN